jgi:hypothetical protein
MDQPQRQPGRRPGPVGFHAEARVTSLRTAPSTNLGGIGESTGPTAETPHRSKELRVAGPLVWGLVGVVVLVVGVVFSILVAFIGVTICVAAVFVNRRNRTEMRLRTEFSDSRMP